MSKFATRIAIPIILVGVFAICVFIILGYQGIAEQEGLNWVFYLIIFFLLIFVFFFGLAIGQNLSSPIRSILDKANELSQGNLSSRVYLETKDELSELAKAFNKIAEDLQISHDQEANAEKSVGLKVKARTQELEETIDALEQKVKNRTIELERLIEETNRLQEAVKSKGSETIKLRDELDDFKQKVGKYKKSK